MIFFFTDEIHSSCRYITFIASIEILRDERTTAQFISLFEYVWCEPFKRQTVIVCEFIVYVEMNLVASFSQTIYCPLNEFFCHFTICIYTIGECLFSKLQVYNV